MLFSVKVLWGYIFLRYFTLMSTYPTNEGSVKCIIPRIFLSETPKNTFLHQQIAPQIYNSIRLNLKIFYKTQIRYEMSEMKEKRCKRPKTLVFSQNHIGKRTVVQCYSFAALTSWKKLCFFLYTFIWFIRCTYQKRRLSLMNCQKMFRCG